MALDRTDLEIIDHLQNNARISNKELATKVGLAPSSCLQRVRALTKEGVLKSSHVVVAKSAMGIGLEALVAVRLVAHSREQFDVLYREIVSIPEALQVFHVSGVKDFQVHLAVRDIEHLRDLIIRVFSRPEVDQCETSLVFELRQTNRLPFYLASEKKPTPRRRRSQRRR